MAKKTSNRPAPALGAAQAALESHLLEAGQVADSPTVQLGLLTQFIQSGLAGAGLSLEAYLRHLKQNPTRGTPARVRLDEYAKKVEVDDATLVCLITRAIDLSGLIATSDFDALEAALDSAYDSLLAEQEQEDASASMPPPEPAPAPPKATRTRTPRAAKVAPAPEPEPEPEPEEAEAAEAGSADEAASMVGVRVIYKPGDQAKRRGLIAAESATAFEIGLDDGTKLTVPFDTADSLSEADVKWFEWALLPDQVEALEAAFAADHSQVAVGSPLLDYLPFETPYGVVGLGLCKGNNGAYLDAYLVKANKEEISARDLNGLDEPIYIVVDDVDLGIRLVLPE